MLRVETKQSNGALTFKLEGRFTGDGAEHVRMLVTRSQSEMKLIIDLAEVMYIDGVGEEVLSFFKRLGAEFVSETAYSQDICERLDLPLLRNAKPNTHVSGGNGYGSASDTRSKPGRPDNQSSGPELLE